MTVGMNDMLIRVSVLFIASLLSGCSGIKAYSSTLPTNFYVKTTVDTGSARMSTVVEVDVHRVNTRCETDHLGRIYLDRPAIEAGLPVEAPLYLDFIFASKAFLSTDSSAIRYATLLTPRSGYEYHAHASYINGIYNVVIHETRRGGSTRKIIERKPLSSCKSIH